MPEIRIKVGASVDANLANVFTPLVTSAKKAREQVHAEAVKAGQAFPTEILKGITAANKELLGLSQNAEKGFAGVGNEAHKAAQQISQATAAVKTFTDVNGRLRYENGRFVGSGGAGGGGGGGGIPWYGANRWGGKDGWKAGLSSVGSVVGRYAAGAVSAGARVGGDLIRGMGVDTDLTSHFKNNVSLETAANQVSNSGYMAGTAGENGKRQDPRDIIAQVRQIANETGMSTGGAMEGLQAFTAKTGDLQTGRDILKDMAVLSKATGTALEDMVSASGDVANALGDTDNKSEKVKAAMKIIAGEGKLGAVEISDLAKQMAKIASSAGQIEGDGVNNIALLGAFAQEARQHGGAASAAQAATAVQGLINTFKTPARANAFTAATGKSVFNDQGLIRNPQQLVMEALKATGSDPLAFKKIFSNIAGGRAVEGFATIYRQAGGGAAGEKAVTAEFERLANAAMADAEILESFTRSMRTTESQTQILNNNLQEAAGSIQTALIPAFAALTPQVIGLTKDFARGIGVVSEMLGIREKGTQQDVATTSNDIETAIANTRDQRNRGVILGPQKDVNEQLQKTMQQDLFQANADVITGKSKTGLSTFEKISMAPMDILSAPGRAIFGGKSVSEQVTNRRQEEQDARVATQEQASEHLRAIKDVNEQTMRLLRDNVIQVRMVNLPKPLPGNNPKATTDASVIAPPLEP